MATDIYLYIHIYIYIYIYIYKYHHPPTLEKLKDSEKKEELGPNIVFWDGETSEQ